eukprot:3756580-Alexandrium_andersonii.AAC.1
MHVFQVVAWPPGGRPLPPARGRGLNACPRLCPTPHPACAGGPAGTSAPAADGGEPSDSPPRPR